MPGDEEQNAVEVTETTEPEPEAQTETTDLTKDPDWVALVEEVKKEARAEGKKEAEETYKGIQRVVSAKDKEIADLRKQPERPAGTMSKQIIDLMEGGEFDKARNLIAVQEQESSRQATIQHQATVTEGHRTRIKQEIVDAGRNPNDEIFEDVFDAIDFAEAVDGKFERVDRKLARTLKANPKKEPEPTQSAEEKALAWIKENNPSLLKTETGSPSASGQSNEDFQKAFIRGEYRNKLDEYEKEARKRGIL